MAISKVIYGEDALIDLTADTVTPETLAAGTTAHNSAGETVIGTVTMLTVEEITQQAAQKVDKESLGLNNVDNTSDMDKPVSTAQQAALAEKAPAGFGLGEEVSVLGTKAQLDAFTGNGFCKYYGEAVLDHPSAQYGGQCVGGVLNIKHGTACTQFFVLDYPNKGSILKRCSWTDLSGWQDWEWVVCPMSVGVKYLTTERHNGKPVYAKLVDCGQLPNNDVINVNVERYPTAQIEAIICCDLYTPYQGGIRWQSGGDHITWNVSYEANEFWADVFTTSDFSSYTGRMLVKWTEA